jgi:PAS domain S-box-containing protein
MAAEPRADIHARSAAEGTTQDGLRLIASVHDALDEAEDEGALLSAAVAALVEQGGYESAFVILLDGEAEAMRCVSRAGGAGDGWLDARRAELSSAMRRCEPLSFEAEGRAAVAVPLSLRRRGVGAIVAMERGARARSAEHALALAEIARSVGRALSHLRARAELEARVAERTAELEDLYENAPCGYHSLGAGGQILRMNATELGWLGYTREEVAGRSYRELVAPAHQPIFDRNFARLSGPLPPGAPLPEPGALAEVEYEVLCKDGSTRTFSVYIAILRDEEGRFVRKRAAVLDVTRRKRVERALHERDAQVRDLLEDARDMIFATDKQGRIAFANPAFCQVLGYTAEEAIGLPLLQVVHPDSHAAADGNLRSLLRGEAPGRRQVERRYVTKHGDPVQVEGVVSARVEQGVVVGTRAFLRDVTRERRVEEAMRQSRDELSAANAALQRASRAKDEFLASMSHELRTPLNAVLGLSEALREGVYGEIGDKGRRALLRIDESGRHLLSLINDILDLSKLEADKVALDVRRVSIDDVCRASVRMIQEAAQKKGQTVALTVDSAAGPVHADERRLVQILVNLLSNAVKFTPQGGEIGLEVAEDGARGTRFTVWDRGIGIAEGELSQLFQPFVQVDASLSRRHAGTGLGLALVRKLVDLHGGGVEVTSALGEGSRFSVILPREVRAAVRPESASPKRRVTPSLGTEVPREARRGAGRVLLAEDDEINVTTIGDYLRSRGYQVLVARNGYEAVLLAREETPDLILMDIQMPEMDGLAAMAEIRSDPLSTGREVPIVALTALAMAGDRERCIAAGADEYLTKPVRLAHLLQVVEARCARAPRTGPAG